MHITHHIIASKESLNYNHHQLRPGPGLARREVNPRVDCLDTLHWCGAGQHFLVFTTEITGRAKEQFWPDFVVLCPFSSAAWKLVILHCKDVRAMSVPARDNKKLNFWRKNVAWKHN